MAQTAFSEALRNFFPPSSGQPYNLTSPLKPGFLIDNLLGKVTEKESHHKLPGGSYSPASFTQQQSIPMPDFRFFGLPSRSMDMHQDSSRFLSSITSSPLFPGNCMPFVSPPTTMHDLRNFMNGVRMDSQNFPAYGKHSIFIFSR